MKLELKVGELLTGALLLMSGNAMASGFALIEQSGSGLGNAYAGGAASAEDASTIFFNPAGMSRLKGRQLVVGGSIISPSIKFSDAGSSPAALQANNNGNGGDAGSPALVPNAYFSMQVDPKTHIGLGINSPFGLQTEYGSNWIGRFQAMKSSIRTVNLNPSISYDLNEQVSLGAGINYQHITGELTSAVNYSAAASGALGPNLEGVSTVSGSDSAWGYNLGALYNLDPQTRLGVAYRSRIKYTLNGSVGFSNVPGGAMASSPQLASGGVALPITMPDTLSMSGFHQFNDKWDVMADATWTGWSVLQQLQITRSSGATLQSVQENWKNTWRFAAGANYHYNERWMARTGIALDQSPVSDAYRTARIPDSNRTWLSVGGQYKVSLASAVDFGYAHLFISNASINQNQMASGAGNLAGSYDSSVDILSAQYTYSF